MNAAEFLNRPQELSRRIAIKDREIEAMRTADGYGGFDYSGIHVQTSPSLEAPFVKITEQIERLEAQRDALILDRKMAQEDIRRSLAPLDTLDREVLRLLYAECLPMYEVADILDRTERHVRRIRQNAMQEFETLWKERA